MMTVDFRALVSVEHRDGFDYLQPQPYGEKGTGVSYEAVPPFGLVGRPRGPADGSAASGIVLRHGPEGFVIATTDPRYQAQLPNLGDGGAALYATANVGGSVQCPYLGFFGAGGAKDEGTFRAEVATAAGITTIEVNATSGDVTITHAGGAVVVVKAASVELGAATGGMALSKAPLVEAWTSLVAAAFTNLGQSVPALTGSGTTKVNGT